MNVSLTYDRDKNLRVTNAMGITWTLSNVQKPVLSFEYDMFHKDENAQTRTVGNNTYPLTEDDVKAVNDYVESLIPPAGVDIRSQITEKVKMKVGTLVFNVIRTCEYMDLSDLLITARPGSKDRHNAEAVAILDWIDYLWESFYNIKEQIATTSPEDLMDVEGYCNLLPVVPKKSYFYDKIDNDSSSSEQTV